MGVNLLSELQNNSYSVNSVKLSVLVDGLIPTLSSPTISFTKATTLLEISDNNGAFANYEIHVKVGSGNYYLLTTTQQQSIVMSDYLTPSDDTYIKVRCVAKNFASSEFSNEVFWQISVGTIGLEYTLASGGQSYICTGIGTATDTDIEIGPVYNGLPVTEISGSAFKDNATITKVTIPSSITTILSPSNNKGAFYNCTALTTVVIKAHSSSLTIQNNAFYDCSSLTDLHIPSNVVLGDVNCFAGCPLQNIYVDSILQYLQYENKLCFNRINSKIYVNNVQVTDLIIPSSITSLSNKKFYGIQIASLDLGNTTTIGEKCFYSSSLKVLDTKNVTSIGYKAFQESAVEKVIVRNVTSLGGDIFAYCSSLSKVIFTTTNLTTLSSGAFFIDSNGSLGSIIIPEGVTTIKSNSLLNSRLRKAILPTTIQTIQNTVFPFRNFNYLTVLANYDTVNNTPVLTNSLNSLDIVNVYVPSASVSDYQSATNWDRYSNKTSAIPSYTTTISVTATGTNSDKISFSSSSLILSLNTPMLYFTITLAEGYDIDTVTSSGNFEVTKFGNEFYVDVGNYIPSADTTGTITFTVKEIDLFENSELA